MPVYVDEEQNSFGRMKMCHMIADTEEELHEMAHKLHLKRDWFQPGSFPHYDVCKSKRKEAIALGAKPISRKELVDIIHRRRGIT